MRTLIDYLYLTIDRVRKAQNESPVGSFEIYVAMEGYRRAATPSTVYRLCHALDTLLRENRELQEQIDELTR